MGHSSVDEGAEEAAKQKDSGFPFKAYTLTKDATGGTQSLAALHERPAC